MNVKRWEKYEETRTWTRKEKWKLIKDWREDVEKACSMCEELQEESVHAEVEYELLVDESKDELFRIRCESEV